MRTKAIEAIYAVYCWDGWQRGHIGDFDKRSEAVSIAKEEARNGCLGDIYYVERRRDQHLVADFCAG